MLSKKILGSQHTQAGATLLELMISIALGLILLAAATAMTVTSMVMNTDTLNSARLNQNLDSVIQIMGNDVRRAGYSKNLTPGQPDVIFADNEDINIVSASCVLYAYNADGDGILDSEEKYGFKLVGNEIHMRTNCATGACSTSCAAGTWVALTDNDIISITSLGFTSENSKCLSLTHPDNVTALTNENNFWVSASISGMQFPCMATAGTDLTTYVLDASDVYASGTFVAPAAGDRLIGSRQVNIDITATLANDAAVTKSQEVGINVRNHHIRTIP